MIRRIFSTPWIYLLLVVSTIGCQPTKVATDYDYFQRGLDSFSRVQNAEPLLKPNDVISIVVSTKTINVEQVVPFNQPGGAAGQGYLVNSAGNIQMPILGSVSVAGLTKTQLEQFLTPKLATYVKEPVITVKYAQFNVNVLGEVGSPGVKTFLTQNVTLLDAIGASGDLRESGKRQNVLVIREVNNTRKYHYVDLRNAAFFQSPVYQLQPNDIVYVAATEKRLKAVAQDPSDGRTLGTISTIFGVATSLFALIYTLTRN